MKRGLGVGALSLKWGPWGSSWTERSGAQERQTRACEGCPGPGEWETKQFQGWETQKSPIAQKPKDRCPREAVTSRSGNGTLLEGRVASWLGEGPNGFPRTGKGL